jgi:hypothetical protein
MNRKLIFFCLILIILFQLPLIAQQISSGDLIIEFFPESSRFNLSVIKEDGSQLPLLYRENPRTSSLSLFYDDTLFSLGDDPSFSSEFIDDSEPRYVWTNDFLQVEQRFGFLTDENNETQGIVITVTIRNKDRINHDIGIRYLFDTYLGEADNVHFQTPTQAAFTVEKEINDFETDWYVSSPDSRSSISFDILNQGVLVSEASTLSLGNWKRLTEAAWNFEANSRRDYNLLPFSVNDSAILMQYGALNLAPGETQSFTTVLGYGTNPDRLARSFPVFNTSELETNYESLRDELLFNSEIPPILSEEEKSDILTLNKIINEIDSRVLDPTTMNSREIEAFEQALAILLRKYGKILR